MTDDRPTNQTVPRAARATTVVAAAALTVAIAAASGSLAGRLLRRVLESVVGRGSRALGAGVFPFKAGGRHEIIASRCGCKSPAAAGIG